MASFHSSNLRLVRLVWSTDRPIRSWNSSVESSLFSSLRTLDRVVLALDSDVLAAENATKSKMALLIALEGASNELLKHSSGENQVRLLCRALDHVSRSSWILLAG